MRIKVVLFLALVSGLVFLSVRYAVRVPTTPAVPTVSDQSAPSQTGPKVGLSTALASRQKPPAQASDKIPPSQEALWDQPVAEPQFAAFKNWVGRYRQAASAEARAALEEEGATLARVRLIAMADLIQANPERALGLAVPDGVRSELPASITTLLEAPVNARGDFQVLAVMPNPDGAVTLPPVVRAAAINGENLEVFTYGAALGYVTKQNVPMSGVAVPLEIASKPPTHRLIQRTKLMALREYPVRILEPQELNALLAKKPLCSISGQPGVVGAAPILAPPLGDLTPEPAGPAPEVFCGPAHLKQWAAAGNAGLSTPDGAAAFPTAESSYTEGRKRMLLMRPVWSNYTGGMTTNDALTHFQNFSNYMFEMSYGKLVLAPLGKGSAITPPMTLPGLVAEYDNTGLGKLYTTCRDVASTTYGYDLTDFDFTYVCTAGAPAASYAGLAYVGGVGFHMANGYWGADVTCHEFGHNLGLNHAHFWDTGARSIIGDGQNVEYGDNNDPMGGGGSPNTYNSRYKNYLGWIHDTDIADLNVTGSGMYRLYCFDLDTSVGLRGLKFTRDTSQNYWLNFRQRKTSKKALMNGVQLLWTGNGNQGSFLLDARLKGDSDDNAIVVGRTFSDSALGFHVTPVRKGHTFPESVDVQVNIGSFPGNQPPSVLASASPLAVNPGQAITFTAAASDPNGDALAFAWDFGDGDYSVDNAATNTHTFTAAGEYYAEVTVSDMKGGVARDSVIVNVGAPATFSISGRVLHSDGRPLSGIRVSVDNSRYAFSESDGTYTITRLGAGSYAVTAVEPVADAFVFANPFFNNPVTVGPDVTAADFIVSTNPPAIVTPIIAANSAWKYLDNGSDQGTDWRAPGFIDTAWASGLGVLGYTDGNDQIDTTISFGPNSANKYLTYYFRRAFTVANPAAFTSLLLRVKRDDGVIVYLNNTEIFRDNMPAGAPTFATTASSAIEPGSYLQQSLPLTGLLAGNNVIAAEIHQANATSSDVAFDLALDGITAINTTAFNAVYLSSPALHQVFTNPPSIILSAFARSTATTASRVDFYADGVKVGEDFSSPFTADWSAPVPGAHELTVVAIFGGNSITSAPVPISVLAPYSLAVEISSPAPGSTFIVPLRVVLTANVTPGPAPVSNVRFFASGILVGQDSAAPYAVALNESSPGVKQVLAVATDSLGNSATSAPVNLTFAGPPIGTQIISFGETWKYLDNGSDQGTAWKVPGFDDRLWAAGPGRLGYGGDGEITVLSFGPDANLRHITTYFRKTFTVADPSAFTGLLLRLVRDDGAVVHLNGVEVFRNNLPPALVNWKTLANAPMEGAAETAAIETRLSTANLVPGENVLAVEIHQAAPDSSDIGFDLSLAGLQTPGSPQEIYLTQPADGAHFNGPLNINLTTYIYAPEIPSPVVEFYGDNTFLGTGSSSSPFTFIWTNVPLGSHQLVAVFAAGNFSTSAPVNIVVGNPPPRIQPLATNLINAGLAWRYWDNVAPAGAGWQMRDFNDSAWPVGTARFGWGLDGEVTTLTEGRVTHYFRRWFNLPEPALLTELAFQLARDDGAVVYLNGVEIFRSNMPNGAVGPNTLAATTLNTPDETIFVQQSIHTAGSGIVAGTNLVAVELHQSSAASSDAGFDLQLSGYGTTEPRVYLTTPGDGASYSGSPVINLEAVARGVGNALVTNVEFYANGSKLGESTASPWRLTWTNAPFGLVTLAARSTDTSGTMTESIPIQIAIGRELVSTTFISSNSVWKYLDTGVNQGIAWVNRTFNDAAWRSGPARLGFGGDGEVTLIIGGPATARFPTVYFRKTFVVQPGAIYTNLLFKLVRDDGAVVYLNGVEAFRSNMPLGPILYSTLTASADDEQSFYPTSVAVANLPAGTNLVAVEVHQTTATSSDLGFNLELTASGYEDAAVPPLLAITLADGQVELRWPTTAVGWQVYFAATIDTPANAWVSATGTLVQVGGQNVFTITPGGGNEFFRLRRP